ncbi:MAG: hypothetical protein M1414_02620 [Candidatus Thermoplasmatota archaeon]|jgi:hydrogenase-4 component E|nr:hypothetical protein [Candidatus Thermoplasmatota archaeon]MCL5987781.1 hypothetical protein [Candidatus Thermoplasmatota archaeon]
MNPFENVIFLAAAMATVAGFYIQAQEFIRSMIRGQLIQSIIIAGIVFILAYLESSPDLVILGILVLVLRGYLVTALLERRIPGNESYVYEKGIGVASHIIMDLVFIILATFIVFSLVFSGIHFSISGGIAGSTIIVFPLAIFFQGLFLIGSRNTTFSQIMGYVEEENALVLFALFIIPVPLIIETSVFLDVLALVVISSIVVMEKFSHEPMEELRG